MSEPEKKVYRLYAAFSTRDNVAAVSEHRFTRVSPYYSLIYSDTPVENFSIIDNSEFHRLTLPEQKWLNDCNIAILAEYVSEHNDEIVKGREQFEEEFSREIERELTATGE